MLSPCPEKVLIRLERIIMVSKERQVSQAPRGSDLTRNFDEGRKEPGTNSQTRVRSEEHTSELQSHLNLVCRLLLEKKKRQIVSTQRRRGAQSHPHAAQLYVRCRC